MLTVDTSSRPPSSQSTASREQYFYALTSSSIVPPPHVAIGNGYDSNSANSSPAPFRKGHRKTESETHAAGSSRRVLKSNGYASDTGRTNGYSQVPQFHRPLFLPRPNAKTTDASDAESYTRLDAAPVKKRSLRLKDISRLQVPLGRGSEGSGSESDITRSSDLPTHDVSSITSTFVGTSGSENVDRAPKPVERSATVRSSVWAISRRSVEGLFPKDELGPRGQSSVEISDSPRIQNTSITEARSRARPSPPPAPLFMSTILPERETVYMTPAKALALKKLVERSSTHDWPDYCRPPVDPRDTNSIYSDSPETPAWAIPPLLDEDVIVYTPPPRTPTSFRASMPSTPRLVPTTSMSRPRRSSSTRPPSFLGNETTDANDIAKSRLLGLAGAISGLTTQNRDSIAPFYPLLGTASRSTESLSLLKTNGIASATSFPSAPLPDTNTPSLPLIKPVAGPIEPHRPYQADYSRHLTPKRASTIPLPSNVARSPAVTLLQAMALSIPAEVNDIKTQENPKSSLSTTQGLQGADKTMSKFQFPQLQRKDFQPKPDLSLDVVKELERRLGKKPSFTTPEKPVEVAFPSSTHEDVQEPRRSRKFSFSTDHSIGLASETPMLTGPRQVKHALTGTRPALPSIQVQAPDTAESIIVEAAEARSRRPSLSATEPRSEAVLVSSQAVHEVERRLRKPSLTTSERPGDSPAVAALRNMPVRQSPAVSIQSSSATPLLYALSIDTQDVPPLPQPSTSSKGSPQESPLHPLKIEPVEFNPLESHDRPVVRPPAKMPLSLRSPSTENIKTRPFPIAGPEPPHELPAGLKPSKDIIPSIGRISPENTRGHATPILSPSELLSNIGATSQSRKKTKTSSKDGSLSTLPRPHISHSRSGSQESVPPGTAKLFQPQDIAASLGHTLAPPSSMTKPHISNSSRHSPTPSYDKALPSQGKRSTPAKDEDDDWLVVPKVLSESKPALAPEVNSGVARSSNTRSHSSRVAGSSSPLPGTQTLRRLVQKGASLAPPDITWGKNEELSESDRSGSKDVPSSVSSKRPSERETPWGRSTDSPMAKQRDSELVPELTGTFPSTISKPDYNRPLAQSNHLASVTSSPIARPSQRKQLMKENDPGRSLASASHARPTPDRAFDPIPQVISPPPPPSGSSKPTTREPKSLTKSHGISSPAVPPKILAQPMENVTGTSHSSHSRHHHSSALQNLDVEREQEPRAFAGQHRSASNQLVPPSSHSQPWSSSRESPLPSRESPIPPALPSRRQDRPSHHRNGSGQAALLNPNDLMPPSQNQSKNLPSLSRPSPSPTPPTLHKPVPPPPKPGKSSRHDASDPIPPAQSHGHRKGHGGGGGSSSSLPRPPSPEQESMPDTQPSTGSENAASMAPPPPPKKTHIFAFWKKTESPSKPPIQMSSTKTQSSASRSKSRPPNPPTPPRESPIPDSRRNADVTRARSPAVAPPPTSYRKHHSSSEKKQEKGILKMFGGGKRAHRTVSNASMEAVLGASNNAPGSPESAAPSLVTHSPHWEDRALAVHQWRKQDADVQTHRARRTRPGVTWELPAGFESLPSSPTTAVAIETIIDRIGSAR